MESTVGSVWRERAQFGTRRQGKKELNSSRDKSLRKARTVVGRGEKSLLYDPGPELRLVFGGREKKKGEYNK